MKKIRILFLGDIVGRPGRHTAAHFIALLKKKLQIDFVIANGENLASGSGITFEKYNEMIAAGVDYFTSGNHIWHNRDIIPYLKEKSVKILRPANYPGESPGDGSVTVTVNKTKITLINLLGRVFMPIILDDPFETARTLALSAPEDSIIIVDFHAEATSEKVAMGYYLDGLVSAVIGTHTHIQTNDEKILEKGTAYITDVGMVGPSDSVLGIEKEIILEQFLTQMPQRHKVALGDTIFNAVYLEIDKKSRQAKKIEKINLSLKQNRKEVSGNE